MEVLIARKNAKTALNLADEVMRAGGRVSGIASNLEDALSAIRKKRGPDLLLLDTEFSDSSDGIAIAERQTAQGRICIFVTTRADAVPDHLREKCPILRGPDISDEMRLLLQAARHFRRGSKAVH